MLLSPSPTDNRDVYSCSGRAVTSVLCFCCGCVGGILLTLRLTGPSNSQKTSLVLQDFRHGVAEEKSPLAVAVCLRAVCSAGFDGR